MTSSSSPAAGNGPAKVFDKALISVSAVVVLGTFMSILDTTIVNVAINTLSKDFNTDLATAATAPLVCDRRPNEFRPYASRERWFRTANDSYFTAMTFPRGMPATAQPSSIHDAAWSAMSAVYGGAVHPTAEGHAAMADAALPAMRDLLGLKAPPEVTAEPLPPPLETPQMQESPQPPQ